MSTNLELLKILTDNLTLRDERIRKNEYVLRRFFNNSSQLLCILDSDGIFLKVNKQWFKRLGWIPKDLKHRNFLDFILESDKEKSSVNFKLTESKHIVKFVSHFLTKEGKIKKFQWTLTPDREIGCIYAMIKILKHDGEE